MPEEQKTYYQPTVEQFKYSFWERVWVHKETFQSSCIFESPGHAHMYRDEYINALKNLGVKLKEGNFRAYNTILSSYNHAKEKDRD